MDHTSDYSSMTGNCLSSSDLLSESKVLLVVDMLWVGLAAKSYRGLFACEMIQEKTTCHPLTLN